MVKIRSAAHVPGIRVLDGTLRTRFQSWYPGLFNGENLKDPLFPKTLPAGPARPGRSGPIFGPWIFLWHGVQTVSRLTRSYGVPPLSRGATW